MVIQKATMPKYFRNRAEEEGSEIHGGAKSRTARRILCARGKEGQKRWAE